MNLDDIIPLTMFLTQRGVQALCGEMFNRRAK
jgi:hypothetical protein